MLKRSNLRTCVKSKMSKKGLGGSQCWYSDCIKFISYITTFCKSYGCTFDICASIDLLT